VRLLITRPQPEAERTAAMLRGRGHDVGIAPLLHIETVPHAPINAGPWSAILLTSANAARALMAHERRLALAGLPVFAAGENSAQAMRAAGFTTVVSAGGGVAHLAQLAAERLRPGASALYLAGEDRAGDLAAELGKKGVVVRTVVVYRARTAEDFPQSAVDAIAGGLDAVLHFSERSAAAYVSAARRAEMLATALDPVHYCLSARVAAPLTDAGAAQIQIAPQPTQAALLDLIGTAA
jgi:uroporphyrinogen-III synthase